MLKLSNVVEVVVFVVCIAFTFSQVESLGDVVLVLSPDQVDQGQQQQHPGHHHQHPADQVPPVVARYKLIFSLLSPQLLLELR